MTSLPLIAGLLFVGGLLALAVLLIQILRSARQSERERKYRSHPWRSDIKRAAVLLLAVAGVAASQFVFWMKDELRLYTPVTEGMPLGLVSVIKAEGSLPRLVISTVDDNGRETYEVFPVRDAAFRIRGERIHWSKVMRPLGLDNFFKVTRIEFFPPNADSEAMAPSFHTEVRRGTSGLFTDLSAVDSWLPIVDVESVASVAFSVEEEFAVRMFADSSGLVLK